MDKHAKAKLNDTELENVSGGQTYWYLRITGTWEDPTGKVYRDGYLVTGKDLHTGQLTSSTWVPHSKWDKFKDLEEFRGNEFIEGDPNPGGILNKK
jgi:hypothetical protein